MSKSICALVHKTGSTREEFQLYYEERHAPLAIGLFPFSAYARNHVVDASGFGWDTISEFRAADIAEAAALMQGPVGETMAADEERFMNRSLIAPAGAEEVVIAPGRPAEADGRRTALLIDGPVDLRAVVLDWAQALSRHQDGVSVDFTHGWGEVAFPAAAVIWLPGWHADCAAPPSLSAQMLRVRHVETPPSSLLGNRAAF